MAQQNGIGFNANQIKVLAIGTMALDHGASVLLETSSWEWCLRLLGRLTAPVMCFFIAEGYHHTSNLKKYMGRLLLLAVISHVPFHLCFGQDVWAIWRSTDVGFSLLFGLVALTIWDRSKISLLKNVWDWLYAACSHIRRIGITLPYYGFSALASFMETGRNRVYFSA